MLMGGWMCKGVLGVSKGKGGEGGGEEGGVGAV